MGDHQGPSIARLTAGSQQYPCTVVSRTREWTCGLQEDGKVHAWQLMGQEGPQETIRVHAWWPAGPEGPWDAGRVHARWSIWQELGCHCELGIVMDILVTGAATCSEEETPGQAPWC